MIREALGRVAMTPPALAWGYGAVILALTVGSLVALALPRRLSARAGSGAL